MPNGISRFFQATRQLLSLPANLRNWFDELQRGQNQLDDRMDGLVDHLHRAFRLDERKLGRYASLVEGKRELIDYTCQMFAIHSFADIGGNNSVPPGGYSFYTMDKYQIPVGYLMDIEFFPEVREVLPNYPNLALIEGNLAWPETAEQIKSVDAILLFDILYIQLDWEAVLDLYADRAQYFLISNVHFPRLKHTIPLLELGKEEYFRYVPHRKDDDVYQELFEKLDEIHPQYQVKYRDVPQYWHWGMTDDDLIAKMKRLGFRLNFAKTILKHDAEYEPECRAFVFTKD
jgi:hypothetical protein